VEAIVYAISRVVMDTVRRAGNYWHQWIIKMPLIPSPGSKW
jgi:hypothetical protein